MCSSICTEPISSRVGRSAVRSSSAESSRDTWQDHGVVLACDPPHQLRYSYYSGSCGLDDTPENYATVTYRLEEAPGGTVLTVHQQGYPSEDSRNSSNGGWDAVLAQVKLLAEAE